MKLLDTFNDKTAQHCAYKVKGGYKIVKRDFSVTPPKDSTTHRVVELQDLKDAWLVVTGRKISLI